MSVNSASLFLSPRSAQSYVNAFLAMSGVVGLWPLWEAGAMGTTYRDVGPNRLHGTLNGTMTPKAMPGSVVDVGLLGDGTTGYVRVPTNAAFDVANIFSMSAIVVAGTGAGGRSIAGRGQKTTSTNGDYYLRINAGKLDFLSSGTTDMVQSTINLTLAAAHHCVATKNGSTSKLYVDGVDVTGTVTNKSLVDSTRDFLIGADTNGLGAVVEFGDNIVAMVGLHNRAITAAEAAFLAAMALGR